MSNLKIVAVIPARGGSKGIKHKNVKNVAGWPLIHYSIETCLKTPGIERVFVSTDSEEIKEAVRHFDGVGIIDRPDDLASDDATSETALIHAIKHLEDTGLVFDAVLFVQATSPLTDPSDFTCLLELLSSGYDSAAFYMEDYGFFFEDDNMLSPRLPRQRRQPKKREAGNGWAFMKKGFLEAESRLFGKVGLCKIEHPKNLEIDDEHDLQIVERLLQLRQRSWTGAYYKVRAVGEDNLYEENYWSKVTDPDGRERDREQEKEQRIADIREELQYINKLKPGKILDIGCGMGELLSEVDDAWDKYGLEVSGYAGERAAKYATIFNGVLEDAPYEEASFDLVVMHHVIEHIEKPEEAMMKVRDLLKHNGNLIIATPDFDGALARQFGENYRLLHDKTHVSLFSRISLRHLLEDTGFRIEREEFPFFETRYFTEQNLLRVFDKEKISPPFWGNFMTLYCRKN